MPGVGASRRVKCVGGPLDGERHWLPAGVTEIAVPLRTPGRGGPDGAALAAVYRVCRRRRGRGVAYVVLAYVRNERAGRSA